MNANVQKPQLYPSGVSLDIPEMTNLSAYSRFVLLSAVIPAALFAVFLFAISVSEMKTLGNVLAGISMYSVFALGPALFYVVPVGLVLRPVWNKANGFLVRSGWSVQNSAMLLSVLINGWVGILAAAAVYHIAVGTSGMPKFQSSLFGLLPIAACILICPAVAWRVFKDE